MRRPTRKRVGWIARATAGMEPKQTTAVVIALATAIGGCWKAQMDAAGTRQQVVQVEQQGAWQRGRLRSRVDSLDQRVGKIEQKLRPVRRPAASDGQWVGPPEPERKGTLLRSLKKLWPF